MGFIKIVWALCLVGGAVLGGSAAAAAPAAAPVAAQELSKVDVDAWLDGYMPYALRTGDIPGAVVVVVKGGKILSARGYGYADVEKRIAVDPERTLFRPGSVSKLVTWTAVMQQVEAKKITLDADVNTYLDFKIPARAGAPVTVRQLMRHTAGFEEAVKGIITYDAEHVPNLGALLKAWVPRRIFDAGTTPAYSNYATALAGYIVERVSGETFDDYVEGHIFKPLRMGTATFRQPLPTALSAHMSKGYAKPGQPPAPFEIIGPAPAGSLTASGVDMGRFMIANLQLGELDGQRIFSKATAQTMFDTPLSTVHPMSVIAPLNRMELGFFETNINGRQVIGHLGDTVAFHTSLHLFMKEGVGFYVSFNSAGKAGQAGTLRTALFHNFADRYLPDTAAADGRMEAALAAEHVRMMAGKWQTSRHSESNFFSALGLLGQTAIEVGAHGELVVPSLLSPNGRPREWVEIAPFVWRDKNGHDRIAAKIVDGQVVRWSMDFMSPFVMFDRVPGSRSSSWITPALMVSVAVFVLTLLSAPAGWLIRRKYKATLELNGRARLAYRGSQWAAGLGVLVLSGWLTAIGMMLSDLKYMSSMDTVLWLLQIVGIVVFPGAIGLTGWNMYQTWTDGRSRGRGRKLWSALLFLSSIVLAYVAMQFGLLAMTVNY